MTNGEKMKADFPDIEMMGESKDTLDYSLGGMVHRITKKWWYAEYEEPSSSVIPNNPIRYIVLQVQISSTSCTICICHGIFNDFYKAVGKCVCLIGDSDDDWIKSAYKLTDRSDMWRTETENGFGWYRKYEHENPEIVVQETWLVIDGDVEL